MIICILQSPLSKKGSSLKVALVGLLVGILGAIPSAFAADWQVLTEHEGFVDYVDVASIKKKENVRAVWRLRSYKSTQTDASKPYRSTKTLWEYDCKNERGRATYVIGYSDEMGGGLNVMSGTDSSGNWTPIIPETIGETALKAVCNR